MIEVLAAGVGNTPDLAAYEALKNAVRQETRVLVETKTWTVNSEQIESVILTKSKALVTSYQIREVKQVNGYYVVRVVAQVNEQALTGELGASTAAKVDGPGLAMRLEQQEAPDPQVQSEEMLAHEFLYEFPRNAAYRRTRPIEVWAVQGDELHLRCAVPVEAHWQPMKETDLTYVVRMLDDKGLVVAEEEHRVDTQGLRYDAAGIVLTHWIKLRGPELARVRKIEAFWK